MKENKGSTEGYSKFATIEKAFNVIEDAIARKLEFEVEYNKQWGYPENLLVNENSRATDTYSRLKIHRLSAAK